MQFGPSIRVGASVGARLGLAVAIPLVAVAVLAMILVLDGWRTASRMDRLHALSQFTRQIGDLVHELQKERGMSVLFLTSDDAQFAAELPSQRQATTERLGDVRDAAGELPLDAYPAALKRAIEAGLAAIRDLETTRTGVSAKRLSADETSAYYIALVDTLLTVPGTAAKSSEEPRITSNLLAFHNYLYATERAALERHTGARGFTNGEFSPALQRAYLTVFAEQQMFLQAFEANATAEQIKFARRTMSGPVVETLESMRKVVIETAAGAALGSIDERAWFAACTARINLMKQVADRLAADLGDTAAALAENAQTHMLRVAAATLVVLVLSAAIAAWLARDITRPIARVVAALEAMAAGDLLVRLQLNRRDEFNAIEVGFNKMTDELKALVGQAQRSAVQMTTSVTEISATSKQQASTASETASTTIEISAASREITATAKDLVRTMSEISSTAEQTSVLAASGQLGLSRMEESMRQVTGAADVVNSKLAVLNEKAGNITKMITTIVKVSDQTNLLSLNAAIEAEKAGEYGRGFGVVASEVRRLADQTAVASDDIDQMVRDIHSAVSAGVMSMDKFSEEVRRGISEIGQIGGQLSQIIQQVQALAPRIVAVSEGMQTQATGAEQINEALVQIGEASGQTAEAIHQAGLAIDELNQMAGDIRASVTHFKV